MEINVKLYNRESKVFTVAISAILSNKIALESVFYVDLGIEDIKSIEKQINVGLFEFCDAIEKRTKSVI